MRTAVVLAKSVPRHQKLIPVWLLKRFCSGQRTDLGVEAEDTSHCLAFEDADALGKPDVSVVSVAVVETNDEEDTEVRLGGTATKTYLRRPVAPSSTKTYKWPCDPEPKN